MAPTQLLEPAEEDALHASRLLSFEDKLYKRLARRLLPADTPFASSIYKAPPKLAVESTGTEGSTDSQDKPHALVQWRNETLLEFAAFESNLARVQFLLKSNALERERYAAENQRIMETASSVRENNAHLHQQLASAKEALEVRKGYDRLAEEITTNSELKPRDEQHTAIEKLRTEITELERECADYARTWAERREQFGKVVDEGTALLRIIRDEKEDGDRPEGGDSIEESTSSPPGSGASTPKLGEDGTTPRPDGAQHYSSLRVQDSVTFLSSAKNSRATTPMLGFGETEKTENMEVDDSDNAPDALEEGEASDTPLEGGKMDLG